MDLVDDLPERAEPRDAMALGAQDIHETDVGPLQLALVPLARRRVVERRRSIARTASRSAGDATRSIQGVMPTACGAAAPVRHQAGGRKVAGARAAGRLARCARRRPMRASADASRRRMRHDWRGGRPRADVFAVSIGAITGEQRVVSPGLGQACERRGGRADIRIAVFIPGQIGAGGAAATKRPSKTSPRCASIQTTMRDAYRSPASDGQSVSATASRAETPMTGSSRTMARPCIAARPIRSPVNAPGPLATTSRSSACRATPASLSARSSSPGSRSPCVRVASPCTTASTSSSRVTAALPARVVVSSARISTAL